MKRKRKEHRSLDSILFEDDDGELEYFDVLNLLPLSNVRLQYDEENDSADGNFERRNEQVRGSRDLRVLEYREPSSAEETSPSTSGGDATDEEKHTAKNNTPQADNNNEEDDDPGKKICEDLDSSRDAARRDSAGGDRRESEESFGEDSEISSTNKFADQRVPSTPSSSSSSSSSTSKFKRERYKADVESFVTAPPCEEDRKIEEVKDYKSIWISDGEEHDEMSRRPQILKVVDNDVTKRRHRRSVVEIDAVVEDVPKDKKPQENAKSPYERADISPLSKATNNARKDGEICGKNAEVSWKPDRIFPP